MTESETFLLDELYESEAAIRSDAHQEDVKRLAAMERETETLQAKIAAKVSRRALAILAWKQSTAYSEDVHAAVEAIADGGPGVGVPLETNAITGEINHPDLIAERAAALGIDDEAPAWIVAEPQVPDFPLCTEGMEASDEEMFEPKPEVEAVRKIIGSYSDVTDEQYQESLRQMARDADRQRANGLDQ